MQRLLANFVGLFALLVGCTHIPPQPPKHSQVSLVVAQSAVTPGSDVNVGIQFAVENGWHIYWQNPGDSGEPPRMQWQLPAGITAGAIEWPTPVRLTNPAGTDFGYEGTTVLLTALRIPATAQPGTTLDVGGDLRWLVCHDICVPQRTTLKAPIHIADATSVDSSAQRVLQTAAEHLPKSLPASFRPTVTSVGDALRVTLVPNQPVTQAQFFPAEPEQVDNGAPQELATQAGKLGLTLKKSEYLREEPSRLRGVLVFNGLDAYQLDVPIHLTKQKGSSSR